MEPDGTRVFRDIIERFNKTSPESPVRLVEGPPSSDTREDMYSTAFLAGGSGYDIVYCDVVWVPKFAAAGWLLDLTDRLSPADGDDFLPADLEAGRYNGRLYRIPAFTDAGLLYYRSDLIRRPGTIAPPGRRRPYSLSLFQSTYWFAFAVLAYGLIWLVTGQTDSLTASILAIHPAWAQKPPEPPSEQMNANPAPPQT